MEEIQLRQRNKQSGQVFIEFILILAMLVSISFGFMQGFRAFTGRRWQYMIQIIAKPQPSSSIQIP